jgi:hypothetical protein
MIELRIPKDAKATKVPLADGMRKFFEILIAGEHWIIPIISEMANEAVGVIKRMYYDNIENEPDDMFSAMLLPKSAPVPGIYYMSKDRMTFDQYLALMRVHFDLFGSDVVHSDKQDILVISRKEGDIFAHILLVTFTHWLAEWMGKVLTEDEIEALD